jgi:hypothetical protein
VKKQATFCDKTDPFAIMKLNTTASKSRLVQSLATVTGTLAATVASSQAATVQITLTGNKISTTGGNTLNADVTGDFTSDIIITNASTRKSVVAQNYGAFVEVNGIRLSAQSFIESSTVKAKAQFIGGGVGEATGSGSIKYLNPISFTDVNINGGVLTQGYLEVHSFTVERVSATVALTRLIFDDASTTLATTGLSTGTTYTTFVPVPEPSSLGLLALGAGGLLARRRRQAA